MEARRDRMYAAYESGSMELERYTERNRELREMHEAIVAERRQILESSGSRTIILDNPEAVLERMDKISQHLRENEPVRCRSWLKRFIRRIWIEYGQGVVEYTIPLPSEAEFSSSTRREFALSGDFRPTARGAPLPCVNPNTCFRKRKGSGAYWKRGNRMKPRRSNHQLDVFYRAPMSIRRFHADEILVVRPGPPRVLSAVLPRLFPAGSAAGVGVGSGPAARLPA